MFQQIVIGICFLTVGAFCAFLLNYAERIESQFYATSSGIACGGKNRKDFEIFRSVAIAGLVTSCIVFAVAVLETPAGMRLERQLFNFPSLAIVLSVVIATSCFCIYVLEKMKQSGNPTCPLKNWNGVIDNSTLWASGLFIFTIIVLVFSGGVLLSGSINFVNKHTAKYRQITKDAITQRQMDRRSSSGSSGGGSSGGGSSGGSSGGGTSGGTSGSDTRVQVIDESGNALTQGQVITSLMGMVSANVITGLIGQKMLKEAGITDKLKDNSRIGNGFICKEETCNKLFNLVKGNMNVREVVNFVYNIQMKMILTTREGKKKESDIVKAKSNIQDCTIKIKIPKDWDKKWIVITRDQLKNGDVGLYCGGMGLTGTDVTEKLKKTFPGSSYYFLINPEIISRTGKSSGYTLDIPADQLESAIAYNESWDQSGTVALIGLTDREIITKGGGGLSEYTTLSTGDVSEYLTSHNPSSKSHLPDLSKKIYKMEGENIKKYVRKPDGIINIDGSETELNFIFVNNLVTWGRRLSLQELYETPDDITKGREYMNTTIKAMINYPQENIKQASPGYQEAAAAATAVYAPVARVGHAALTAAHGYSENKKLKAMIKEAGDKLGTNWKSITWSNLENPDFATNLLTIEPNVVTPHQIFEMAKARLKKLMDFLKDLRADLSRIGETDENSENWNEFHEIISELSELIQNLTNHSTANEEQLKQLKDLVRVQAAAAALNAQTLQLKNEIKNFGDYQIRIGVNNFAGEHSLWANQANYEQVEEKIIDDEIERRKTAWRAEPHGEGDELPDYKMQGRVRRSHYSFTSQTINKYTSIGVEGMEEHFTYDIQKQLKDKFKKCIKMFLKTSGYKKELDTLISDEFEKKLVLQGISFESNYFFKELRNKILSEMGHVLGTYEELSWPPEIWKSASGALLSFNYADWINEFMETRENKCSPETENLVEKLKAEMYQKSAAEKELEYQLKIISEGVLFYLEGEGYGPNIPYYSIKISGADVLEAIYKIMAIRYNNRGTFENNPINEIAKNLEDNFNTFLYNLKIFDTEGDGPAPLPGGGNVLPNLS